MGVCSNNLEVLGGGRVAAQRPVNWKEGIDSIGRPLASTHRHRSTYVMHAYTIIKLTQKVGVWLDGLVYKHSCISPYL